MFFWLQIKGVGLRRTQLVQISFGGVSMRTIIVLTHVASSIAHDSCAA